MQSNVKRACFRWQACLLVLYLFMIGCAPTTQEVINTRHRPTPIKTVVSLSPGATELIPYLNLQLVGRTQADNVGPAANAPVVITTKPEYESIEQIRPDLVIYDASLFNANDIQKIDAMNIPTFAIMGNTVSAYIDCLYKLGSLVGAETTINEQVQYFRNAIANAAADPISEPHSVALLMTVPNGNPMIACTGSFYADIMRQAGGIPVGPGGTNFQVINPESLISLNPDAIAVTIDETDKKGTEVTSFVKDSRFSGLKAVKEGHVFGVEANYILRRGIKVSDAIKSIHSALVQVLVRNL